MNKLLMIPVALLAAVLAAPSGAQMQPESKMSTMTSEPGKVRMTESVTMSAKVVAIDKAGRVVSLKGPKGNVVDMVCGDDVKNFDQIKLGDMVVAHYVDSLYLKLMKTSTGVREGVEIQAAGRAQPGERPAGAVVKETTILADVIAVDPKKQTVTLKGPKNNILEVPVRNPEQFKLVKEGDQVEATYTQAAALSVEAAPAAASKY
jgi:hypothetical protein